MSAAPSCKRCESPLEAEDLRCPVCALGTPSDAPVPERARATILRCDGCGVAMQYAAEIQAPRCAFCGEVCHLEEPEDPIEQAEAIVSFGVFPAEAQELLRIWMANLGFFRPSNLSQASTIQELKPLWWAAYNVGLG